MQIRLVFTVLVLVATAVWSAVLTLPDNRLHIVVCDVGQGDAILLYQGTTQILVDAGLNSQVVGCLGEHMPFFDRRLEMVILTHPQHDHIGGVASVAESYTILQIVSNIIRNDIAAFEDLQRYVSVSRVPLTTVSTGDEIAIGDIKVQIIWPTREFLAQHVAGDRRVLGASTDGTDLNSFSIVALVSYGNFDVLLTGDGDHQIQLAQLATGLLRDIEVLKVPHHGGKQAVLPQWVEAITPEIGIISVGKNNRYDHPRPETIDILENNQVRVLRTDESGDVEVVTDGSAYWLK